MRLTHEETEEFQKSFVPVSYGHLSRQLIEHSYSEFLDLLGRCTSDPNVQEEAKTCLWEYSAEIREVFLRMLAIGNLSRIVPEINRVIQQRETLVSLRFKERKLAFDLYPALTMVGTPDPNISAAIDVILLKDFPQMPNLLEELVSQFGKPIIVPKMSKIQEELVEEQLKDEFFIQYANSKAMKSKLIHFEVIKGRIHLKKKSRFSLVLISDLKQWQVIDAKITIPDIVNFYGVRNEQNNSFRETLQMKIYYLFNCKVSQEDNSSKDQSNQDLEESHKNIDVIGELYEFSNIITGEIILETLLEQSILNIKEQSIAGIYYSERNEYRYNEGIYKFLDIYLYRNVDISFLTRSDNNKDGFEFSRFSLIAGGSNKTNSNQTLLKSSWGANIILRFLMLPNGEIKCILWPFSILFSYRQKLSQEVNSVLDIVSDSESWKYLCNWEKSNYEDILDLSKILNHVSNVLRCYILELYSFKLERCLSKNGNVYCEKYQIYLRILDYSEYLVELDILSGSLTIRDTNLNNDSIWKEYPEFYDNLVKAVKSSTNSLLQLIPVLIRLTKFQMVRDEFVSSGSWRPIYKIAKSIQDLISVERRIKSETLTENFKGPEVFPENLTEGGISSVIVNTVKDNILTITNCTGRSIESTEISRNSEIFDFLFYPSPTPNNSRIIYIQVEARSLTPKRLKIFFMRNCLYQENIEKVIAKNNQIYQILGIHNFEHDKTCHFKGKVVLAEFDANFDYHSSNEDSQEMTCSGAKELPMNSEETVHVENNLHEKVESCSGIFYKEVVTNADVNGREFKAGVLEVLEYYSGIFIPRHAEVIEFLESVQESVKDYFPFGLYARLGRNGQLDLGDLCFGLGMKEYRLYFLPYKDCARQQYLSGGKAEFFDKVQFKLQFCNPGVGKLPILNRRDNYGPSQTDGGLTYKFVIETNQSEGNSTLYFDGEIPTPLICSKKHLNEFFFLRGEGHRIEFSLVQDSGQNFGIPEEFNLVKQVMLAVDSREMKEAGISTVVDSWNRVIRFLQIMLETIYMAYYSKPNYGQRSRESLSLGDLNPVKEVILRKDFVLETILPWEIGFRVLPWSLVFGDLLVTNLFKRLNYTGGLCRISLISASESFSKLTDTGIDRLEQEKELEVFDYGNNYNGISNNRGNNQGYNHPGENESRPKRTGRFEALELVKIELVDTLLSEKYIEIYRNYLSEVIKVEISQHGPRQLCKAFWKVLRTYEVSVSVSMLRPNPTIRGLEEILRDDIKGHYDFFNTLSLKEVEGIEKFVLSFGLRKIGMHIMLLFELDQNVHYKLKISLFDVQNIQTDGTLTQQSAEVISHTRRLLIEFIRIITCQIIDFDALNKSKITDCWSNLDISTRERLEHITRNIQYYQASFQTDEDLYFYPGYFFQRIIRSLSQFFTSSFYVSIASGVTQRKLTNAMNVLLKNGGDPNTIQQRQPILNWSGSGGTGNKKYSQFSTFPIKQPIIEFTWFYSKMAPFDVDRKHILSFNRIWEAPRKYHKIPIFINYRFQQIERDKIMDDSCGNENGEGNKGSKSTEVWRNGDDLGLDPGKLASICKVRGLETIFHWELEFDVPFFIAENVAGSSSVKGGGGFGATLPGSKRSFSELEKETQENERREGGEESPLEVLGVVPKRKRVGGEGEIEIKEDARQDRFYGERRDKEFPVIPIVCFSDYVRSGDNRGEMIIMDMSYSLELFTSPISSEFDTLGQILQSIGNLSQSRALVRIVTIALCSSLAVIRDISTLLKYPLLSFQGKIPIHIDLICQHDDLLVPIEKEEKTYFLRGLLYRVWNYNKIKAGSIGTGSTGFGTACGNEPISFADIYISIKNIPVRNLEEIEINGNRANLVLQLPDLQSQTHKSLLSAVVDGLFGLPFVELRRFHSSHIIPLLDFAQSRKTGNLVPSRGTFEREGSGTVAGTGPIGPGIGPTGTGGFNDSIRAGNNAKVTVGEDVTITSSGLQIVGKKGTDERRNLSYGPVPLTGSPTSRPIFDSSSVLETTTSPGGKFDARATNPNLSPNMSPFQGPEIISNDPSVAFSRNGINITAGRITNNVRIAVTTGSMQQQYKSNSTGQISVGTLHVNSSQSFQPKQIPFNGAAVQHQNNQQQIYHQSQHIQNSQQIQLQGLEQTSTQSQRLASQQQHQVQLQQRKHLYVQQSHQNQQYHYQIHQQRQQHQQQQQYHQYHHNNHPQLHHLHQQNHFQPQQQQYQHHQEQHQQYQQNRQQQYQHHQYHQGNPVNGPNLQNGGTIYKESRHIGQQYTSQNRQFQHMTSNELLNPGAGTYNNLQPTQYSSTLEAVVPHPPVATSTSSGFLKQHQQLQQPQSQQYQPHHPHQQLHPHQQYRQYQTLPRGPGSDVGRLMGPPESVIPDYKVHGLASNSQQGQVVPRGSEIYAGNSQVGPATVSSGASTRVQADGGFRRPQGRMEGGVDPLSSSQYAGGQYFGLAGNPGGAPGYSAHGSVQNPNHPNSNQQIRTNNTRDRIKDYSGYGNFTQ
ncbi:hypothetical protein HWI79_1177 [Cryptosporidium felis]|nr:hypothetical protein HWI79_1177 [Cryptosporidium felis]